MSELEVRHGRLRGGRRERTAQRDRQCGAQAGVHVRRLQRLAHDALQQEALLVGGLAPGEGAGAALRAAESERGLLERALPAHLSQHPTVAHHRLRDPLVDVHRLVGEAALVAQPAVVDLGVVAAEHAQHALVADGEGHVALRRAHRADRARVLDVPRACAEAVGLGGQRAHGA